MYQYLSHGRWKEVMAMLKKKCCAGSTSHGLCSGCIRPRTIRVTQPKATSVMAQYNKATVRINVPCSPINLGTVLGRMTSKDLRLLPPRCDTFRADYF